MRALLLLAAAAFAPIEGTAAPRIEADRDGVDFGVVFRGERLTSSFTLANRGDADLVIEKITAECTCTASRFTIDGRSLEEAELKSARQLGVLSPGEEAQLEVVLRTAVAMGPGDEKVISKSIRVHSNDPARAIFKLAIKATMISPFTVEPKALDFGVVRKGAAAKCAAVIWSDQLGDFPITGVSVPQPDRLAVKATRVETKPGLPPTWRVEAELLPAAPIGTVEGHVDLAVDHPRVKEIRLLVRWVVEPSISFTDNKEDDAELLDFGQLAPGAPRTVELTIVNGDARVPYLLRDAQLKECRPTSEGFVAEVVEIEKGMKYVVKLTAPQTLGKTSYFHGNVELTADHPDVPVRRVRYRGWFKSAGK